MDRSSLGFILLVTVGVLGGLVLVLGAIYAYIWCVKIRPRHRPMGEEHRISHYSRDLQTIPSPAEEQQKGKIKTHPFFIVSYMSRVKAEEGNHPSTSHQTKRF